MGQFQFPLSAESGMEISSLGSQTYTHYCPAQRNNTQQWEKYNLVKIEIQHLINLTNQTVKLNSVEKMVSYKVSVRCKDSAVLGVEQRSKKGSKKVTNLIYFAFFLPSFDLVRLTQGGGGGDLLQRQGDDQQQ